MQFEPEVSLVRFDQGDIRQAAEQRQMIERACATAPPDMRTRPALQLTYPSACRPAASRSPDSGAPPSGQRRCGSCRFAPRTPYSDGRGRKPRVGKSIPSCIRRSGRAGRHCGDLGPVDAVPFQLVAGRSPRRLPREDGPPGQDGGISRGHESRLGGPRARRSSSRCAGAHPIGDPADAHACHDPVPTANCNCERRRPRAGFPSATR